jgi:hypothetical protein
VENWHLPLLKIFLDIEPSFEYNESSRTEKSMFERIAQIMNEKYGASDMDPGLVENYLRNGDSSLISGDEMIQIDVLIDRLL